MADATDLSKLIAAKSALIDSLVSGDPPVLEYEVRGKKVKFESSAKMLESLEAAIRVSRQSESITVGRAQSRNRARTGR